MSRCAWVLRHLQLLNQNTTIIHYLRDSEGTRAITIRAGTQKESCALVIL